MHLSDHDLRQLDEAYLDGLTPEQARGLLSRALEDLKAARERLNQNPSNSSRPPSSRAPWETRDPGEVPASDPPTPGEAAESDRDATASEPEAAAGETPREPAKAPASDEARAPRSGVPADVPVRPDTAAPSA